MDEHGMGWDFILLRAVTCWYFLWMGGSVRFGLVWYGYMGYGWENGIAWSLLVVSFGVLNYFFLLRRMEWKRIL